MRKDPDYRLLFFLPKVNKNGPISALGRCWIWIGHIHHSGYGLFNSRGSGSMMAHRWYYEYLHGPLGDLTLDHLCRNKICVNPDHLEPVTMAENARRAFCKTHCKWGHEFTPENTVMRKGGGKWCRACGRRRAREYNKHHKDQRNEWQQRWRAMRRNHAASDISNSQV